MKDEQQQFEYDIQKRANAGTAATFRGLISVYIIYLGITTLKGVLDGSSPIPLWAGWLVAVVFTGGAAAFGVYTWKTYQREKEAARLPVKPEEEAEAEEETEENSEQDTDGEDMP